MPRIATLFAALCITAAPIIAATNSSAQKEADKPVISDKADQADKASKPEPNKTDKLDLDKTMRQIKDMVDKQLKDSPTPK